MQSRFKVGDLLDAISPYTSKWEVAQLLQIVEQEKLFKIKYLHNNQSFSFIQEVTPQKLDLFLLKSAQNFSSNRKRYYLDLTNENLNELISQLGDILDQQLTYSEVVQFIEGRHKFSICSIVQLSKNELDKLLVIDYIDAVIKFFYKYIQHVMEILQLDRNDMRRLSMYSTKIRDIYQIWMKNIKNQFKNIEVLMVLLFSQDKINEQKEEVKQKKQKSQKIIINQIKTSFLKSIKQNIIKIMYKCQGQYDSLQFYQSSLGFLLFLYQNYYFNIIRTQVGNTIKQIISIIKSSINGLNIFDQNTRKVKFYIDVLVTKYDRIKHNINFIQLYDQLLLQKLPLFDMKQTKLVEKLNQHILKKLFFIEKKSQKEANELSQVIQDNYQIISIETFVEIFKSTIISKHKSLCQIIKYASQHYRSTQILKFLEWVQSKIFYHDQLNQKYSQILYNISKFSHIDIKWKVINIYYKYKQKHEYFDTKYLISILKYNRELKQRFLHHVTKHNQSSIIRKLIIKIISQLRINQYHQGLNTKLINRTLTSIQSGQVMIPKDEFLIIAILCYRNKIKLKKIQLLRLIKIFLRSDFESKKDFIETFIRGKYKIKQLMIQVFENMYRIQVKEVIDYKLVEKSFIGLMKYNKNLQFLGKRYILKEYPKEIQTIFRILKSTNNQKIVIQITRKIQQLFSNIRQQNHQKVITPFFDLLLSTQFYCQYNYKFISFLIDHYRTFKLHCTSDTYKNSQILYFMIQIDKKTKYLQFHRTTPLSVIRKKISELVFENPSKILIFDQMQSDFQYPNDVTLAQIYFNQKYIRFQIEQYKRNKIEQILYYDYYQKLFLDLPKTWNILIDIGKKNKKITDYIQNQIFNGKTDFLYPSIEFSYFAAIHFQQIDLNKLHPYQNAIINFLFQDFQLNMKNIELSAQILAIKIKIMNNFAIQIYDELLFKPQKTIFISKLISLIGDSLNIILYQQPSNWYSLKYLELAIDTLVSLNKIFKDGIYLLKLNNSFEKISLIQQCIEKIQQKFPNHNIYDYRQYLSTLYFTMIKDSLNNMEIYTDLAFWHSENGQGFKCQIITNVLIKFIKQPPQRFDIITIINQMIVPVIMRGFYDSQKFEVKLFDLRFIMEILRAYPRTYIQQYICCEVVVKILSKLNQRSQQYQKLFWKFLQKIMKFRKISNQLPICLKDNLLKYLQQPNRKIEMKPDWKHFKRQKKLCGIINPNSICYMISLFQLLSKNQIFFQSFQQMDWIKKQNQNHDVILQLKRIFFKLKYPRQRQNKICLKKFYKIWHNSDGTLLNIKIQNDVSQFFLQLIEYISSQFAPNNDLQINLVKSVFTGVIQQIIKSSCGHISRREQQFTQLFLQVKNFSRLQDSIYNYFQDVNLTQQNSYFCERCQQKRAAIKSTKIIKSPKTLLIILKRLQFQDSNKKIMSRLEFPINQFKITSRIANKTYRYQLKGIINHSGKTATSGHYTAIIREDNKWISYNDKVVKQISCNGVIRESFGNEKTKSIQQAYMLSYQLKQQQEIVKENFDCYIGLDYEINMLKQEEKNQKNTSIFYQSSYKFVKFVKLCLNNIKSINLNYFCFEFIFHLIDDFDEHDQIKLLKICNKLLKCKIDPSQFSNLNMCFKSIQKFFDIIPQSKNNNRVYFIQVLLHHLKDLKLNQIQKFLNILIYLTYTSISANQIYFVLWILSIHNDDILQYLRQKKMIGRILDRYFYADQQDQNLLTDIRDFTDVGYHIKCVPNTNLEQKQSFRWCLLKQLLTSYHLSQEEYCLLMNLKNKNLFIKLYKQATTKINIINISFFLSFLTISFETTKDYVFNFLQNNPFQKIQGPVFALLQYYLIQLLEMSDESQLDYYERVFYLYKQLVVQTSKQNFKKVPMIFQWFYKNLKINKNFRYFIKNKQFNLDFLRDLDCVVTPFLPPIRMSYVMNRYFGIFLNFKYQQVVTLIKSYQIKIFNLLNEENQQNQSDQEEDVQTCLYLKNLQIGQSVLFYQVKKFEYKIKIIKQKFGSILILTDGDGQNAFEINIFDCRLKLSGKQNEYHQIRLKQNHHQFLCHLQQLWDSGESESQNNQNEKIDKPTDYQNRIKNQTIKKAQDNIEQKQQQIQYIYVSDHTQKSQDDQSKEIIEVEEEAIPNEQKPIAKEKQQSIIQIEEDDFQHSQKNSSPQSIYSDQSLRDQEIKYIFKRQSDQCSDLQQYDSENSIYDD